VTAQLRLVPKPDPLAPEVLAGSRSGCPVAAMVTLRLPASGALTVRLASASWSLTAACHGYEWTRWRAIGVGICTHLAAGLITADSWGYPIVSREPLQRGQRRAADAAIAACPRHAVFLEHG
jgi:ferredoxin